MIEENNYKRLIHGGVRGPYLDHNDAVEKPHSEHLLQHWVEFF